MTGDRNRPMWKIVSGHYRDSESRFYNEMTRAERAEAWVDEGYISVGFDGRGVDEAFSLKSFVERMQPGDLVVFRTEGEIRLGRMGDYRLVEDPENPFEHQHRRDVEWLALVVRDKRDADMEQATFTRATVSPIKDVERNDGVNFYTTVTDRFGLDLRYTVPGRPLGRTAEHVKANYAVVSRRDWAGPFEATVAATNRHNQTQNDLLDWLRRHFTPDAVQACDSAFGWNVKVDLLLVQDDRITVIEVKSIQGGNDVDQLRYGLTQTLDYMDQYSSEGRDVDGVLWLSAKPTDAERWRRLCDHHGVRLGWPGKESAVFAR